jgi:alkaline phosphatase D
VLGIKHVLVDHERTFIKRTRPRKVALALQQAGDIGGDIHSYWADDLKADFNNTSSATVATQFVGTSITSNSPPAELLAFIPENPLVRYFERRYRGYVAVDLTRDRMEARLQVISDRRDPNTTLSTLRRFVVESGEPGAIPG